ncbi:hypothetical protein H257_14829 [Aphanomyces astaci]|uniref:Uncharacterized protein n=1 Tax=Aphanomyces astaci TaxID=112090 RepID=W4FRJ5_APHAT|nr:hypothetical protein H257_14829 [Aphanomyces astaci]ETV69459.1 hypothetical protein H257_14829 [Aphanomyces astaci]|eukprot:XP_009841032.1 hypothetical protein H257_14829 [Aphanomyces astaci]
MSLPSTPPAGALPFAAYPPEIVTVQRLGQHLGNQVQAAVHEQSARLDDKVHLHHQQQLHSQQKMEMNNRLMAELEDQRRRQEVLVEQLNAQKKQTKAHEQGLHQAAAASVKHGEQLEEMRRRTSARWHAFSATLVPAIAAPTTSPAVAGV